MQPLADGSAGNPAGFPYLLKVNATTPAVKQPLFAELAEP
jgi:hypothetical protein